MPSSTNTGICSKNTMSALCKKVWLDSFPDMSWKHGNEVEYSYKLPCGISLAECKVLIYVCKRGA